MNALDTIPGWGWAALSAALAFAAYQLGRYLEHRAWMDEIHELDDILSPGGTD